MVDIKYAHMGRRSQNLPSQISAPGFNHPHGSEHDQSGAAKEAAQIPRGILDMQDETCLGRRHPLSPVFQIQSNYFLWEFCHSTRDSQQGGQKRLQRFIWQGIYGVKVDHGMIYQSYHTIRPVSIMEYHCSLWCVALM